MVTNTSASDANDHYIATSIQYGRVDLAVIKDDGTIKYIMGEDKDESVHLPPPYPSNCLPLATFTYSQNITNNTIWGSCIENIYNNNYIGTSPVVGKQEKGEKVQTHTLFL